MTYTLNITSPSVYSTGTYVCSNGADVGHSFNINVGKCDYLDFPILSSFNLSFPYYLSVYNAATTRNSLSQGYSGPPHV